MALDISPDILKIARQNIKKWFGNKVQYEEYQLDIKYDRFSAMLAGDYIHDDKVKTLNLILVFGGTFNNLRDPDGAFRVIHDSMGLDDLLIYTQKLDSETSRNYFDFNVDPGQTKLAPIHKVVADMLNIDESFYDIEVGYDQQRRERFEVIKLNSALIIQFNFEAGQRTINFDKGQGILVWRAKQSTAIELFNQFDRNNLSVIHSSQTPDQEYILTISRIKHA
jgi:SAM-dependent methyltransferase